MESGGGERRPERGLSSDAAQTVGRGDGPSLPFSPGSSRRPSAAPSQHLSAELNHDLSNDSPLHDISAGGGSGVPLSEMYVIHTSNSHNRLPFTAAMVVCVCVCVCEREGGLFIHLFPPLSCSHSILRRLFEVVPMGRVEVGPRRRGRGTGESDMAQWEGTLVQGRKEKRGPLTAPGLYGRRANRVTSCWRRGPIQRRARKPERWPLHRPICVFTRLVPALQTFPSP